MLGTGKRLLHHASRRNFAAKAAASSAPVAILGGGPSGLLMALLLDRYQVPSLLLEQQSPDQRFRHPQAHFLNTRTMEILRYDLPRIYEDVTEAMPPVDHWKSFRFVDSMSSPSEPLAEVVHPVDRPLRANVDCNGVLREDLGRVIAEASTEQPALSACTVGHLAQHTFGRILYQRARDARTIRLAYGTHVKDVRRCDDKLEITTASGQTYDTNLLIAADGAHSLVRQQYRVPFRGRHAMQHLMNIHIRVAQGDINKIHGDGRHAMLYSIFNEHVVAMVVCHSLGEYIVQIPFFHPYQDASDFGGEDLLRIVQSILGPDVEDYEIVSSRPWTMSALIADQFYVGNNMALVGDAAHVFPPAGGFGMNTGIGDVHNLAWKVASAYHDNALTPRLRAILQSYHDERRPIAICNANLSIRNYARLLQVMKSCYLDNRHPEFLQSTLELSPLPMAAKKTIFCNLLNTALYPLSWLRQPESMYAKHIREKLRAALQSGAGLPLLFPSFELQYSYNNMTYSTREHEDCLTLGATNNGRAESWKGDTIAPKPSWEVGKLVPHVQVKVQSSDPIWNIIDSAISIAELPGRVQCIRRRPTFLLLLFSDTHREDLSQAVLSRDNVEMINMGSNTNATAGFLSMSLIDRHGGQASLPKDGIVLVRPDGHIAALFDVESHLSDVVKELDRQTYD